MQKLVKLKRGDAEEGGGVVLVGGNGEDGGGGEWRWENIQMVRTEGGGGGGGIAPLVWTGRV